MKKIIVLVILFLFIPFLNTVEAIKGTVIDSETGSPIEGAIVFARWTKTEGYPGMSSTKIFKIDETITDNNGNFSLLDARRDRPTLVIYKKGYTAWNNEYIFPDWKKREGWEQWAVGKPTEWVMGKSAVIVRLDKFIPDYTYASPYTYYNHMEFLNAVAILNSEGVQINKAVEWEQALAREEVYKKVQVKWSGKVVDEWTELPIEGATAEISGRGLGYPKDGIKINVVSDKEGNISLNGSFPLARPLGVSVQKEGYVLWIMHYDSDFRWQNGYLFKLRKKIE